MGSSPSTSTLHPPTLPPFLQQGEAKKQRRGGNSAGMCKGAAFGTGWKGDLSRIRQVHS